MVHTFDADVVRGVLHHMNSDHTADSLLIARAFAPSIDVTAATMSGFDGEGGDWTAITRDGSPSPVRVPWPGGPITERREVRREIIALYDEACARLGVEPRPHE